eukprot:7138834-Pyramimonas_sp.AAC.1
MELHHMSQWQCAHTSLPISAHSSPFRGLIGSPSEGHSGSEHAPPAHFGTPRTRFVAPYTRFVTPY